MICSVMNLFIKVADTLEAAREFSLFELSNAQHPFCNSGQSQTVFFIPKFVSVVFENVYQMFHVETS